MLKKHDFSKKIIKILSEKPAVSLPELENIVPSQRGPLTRYSVTRTLKNLKKSGLIEKISSGQRDYARLTTEGRKKANLLKLENDNALVSSTWDGYWRIILLDLPEERKNERESLRYLLKKAGFVALKNSVWISPYPFEYLFMNIKKDLSLSTELMIIVTQFVDEETKKVLFEIFGV